MTKPKPMTEQEFEAALAEVNPFTPPEVIEALIERAPNDGLAETVREFLNNARKRQGIYGAAAITVHIPATRPAFGFSHIHSYPT